MIRSSRATVPSCPGCCIDAAAGAPARLTGIAGFPAGSPPTRLTGIAGFPAGSPPTRLTGIAGFPAGSAPTRLTGIAGFPAGSAPTRLTGIAGFPAGSAPTRLCRDRRLSSRLGADAANRDRRLSSRLGADAANAASPIRGMANRPAPAPQIARRGHRAPGTRSRLKAGAPNRDRRLSSRLGADAARCRVGGVRADKRAHARSSAPAARHGQPPGSRAADRAPGASSPRHAKPAESRRSQSAATGIAGFPAGSPPTRLNAASAASGPIRGHMRSPPPGGAPWPTARLPRRRSRAGGIEPPAREAG
jgi:hypothetical protein